MGIIINGEKTYHKYMYMYIPASEGDSEIELEVCVGDVSGFPDA